jgi:D-sedoheptulose 7-phosphate isomerase
MQIELYKKGFNDYFNLPAVAEEINNAVQLIQQSKRIFFVGNGGSNSICSHMMEDYAKIGRIPTFSFSDAALITCFANDYGYDKAIAEWIKIHFTEGDVLVAISSSGKSPNILNAVDFVASQKGKIITLSGFNPGNPLKQKGTINFHIPLENYGIVECYHQVILHIVLDEIVASKK